MGKHLFPWKAKEVLKFKINKVTTYIKTSGTVWNNKSKTTLSLSHTHSASRFPNITYIFRKKKNFKKLNLHFHKDKKLLKYGDAF